MRIVQRSQIRVESNEARPMLSVLMKNIFFSIYVLMFLGIHSLPAFAKCAGVLYRCVEIEFLDQVHPAQEKITKEYFGKVKIIKLGTEKPDFGNVEKNLELLVLKRDEFLNDPGDIIFGDLNKICFDTGRWTQAEYHLELRDQEYCSFTSEKRMEEVQKKVEKIILGTSREEVNKIYNKYDVTSILKEWTSYYAHPNVNIVVPFDLSGGYASHNNRVNGEIKIKSR